MKPPLELGGKEKEILFLKDLIVRQGPGATLKNIYIHFISQVVYTTEEFEHGIVFPNIDLYDTPGDPVEDSLKQIRPGSGNLIGSGGTSVYLLSALLIAEYFKSLRCLLATYLFIIITVILFLDF